MIYEYVCKTCHTTETREMTVQEFDAKGREQKCSGCREFLTLRITGGRFSFVRSPFPRGVSEHIAPDPVYIRDKKEAIDVAAENGLTSVYCENDM